MVVPQRKVEAVRRDFYASLRRYIQPKPNHMAMPPEIHGKCMPGDTPEEIIANFAAIVDIVLRHRLQVYRIGYYVTHVTRENNPEDQYMFGTCWHSLLNLLSPVLAKRRLTPVMDGLDPKIAKSFSATVRSCHVMHSVDGGRHCSIPHMNNMDGEVFYADSRYSVGTQIVDIVSYLRMVMDLTYEGYQLQPFKKRLAAEARRLHPMMYAEHIIAFTIEGVPQGPRWMARKPMESGPLVASHRHATHPLGLHLMY
jgi:hypothetical protein